MKTSRSKPFRGIILAIVIVAFLYGLGRIYYHLTDDFRMANITYSVPNRPEWDITPLNELEKKDLNMILTQEFHYLGKGAQSYAFESHDGKYVLKFVKFKHIRPSPLLGLVASIPPFKEYREKEKQRKFRKMNGIYSGYLLAYQVHKNEAGLIYIHFNRTNEFKRDVVLYDKLGLKRHVDLDSAIFIVQEKGKTLRTVLSEILDQGHTDLAKHKIRQIFDLYLSEYQKGIYDHDHGVIHNTGYVGDKPIHLDVGKLYKAEEMKNRVIYQEDLNKIFRKIELWLNVHYPKLSSEIIEDMQNKYAEMFGERLK